MVYFEWMVFVGEQKFLIVYKLKIVLEHTILIYAYLFLVMYVRNKKVIKKKVTTVRAALNYVYVVTN